MYVILCILAPVQRSGLTSTGVEILSIQLFMFKYSNGGAKPPIMF